MKLIDDFRIISLSHTIVKMSRIIDKQREEIEKLEGKLYEQVISCKV